MRTGLLRRNRQRSLTDKSATSITESSSKTSEECKVNGVPDWESPMAATNTSVKPFLTRSKLPTCPKRTLKATASSESVQRENDVYVYPKISEIPEVEDDEINEKVNSDFENMVIDCEGDEYSVGELTSDGSTTHDNQYNGINVSSSQRRLNIVVPRNECFSNQRLHKYPPEVLSNNMLSNISDDVDDEEQRLIDIALQRSLRDYASKPSGDLSNDNAATWHESTDCRESLSIFPEERDAIRNEEKKRWSKRPIHSNSSGVSCDLGLKKIVEVEEQNFNDSFQFVEHQNRKGGSYGDQISIDELSLLEDSKEIENLEQCMLNEALHRSMVSLNTSAIWTTNEKSTKSSPINKAAMAERLRQLDNEKALLEMALQDEMHNEEAKPDMSMVHKDSVTNIYHGVTDQFVAPRTASRHNDSIKPVRSIENSSSGRTSLCRAPSLHLDFQHSQPRACNAPLRASSFSNERRSFQTNCISRDARFRANHSLDDCEKSSHTTTSSKSRGSLSGAGCHLAMIAGTSLPSNSQRKINACRNDGCKLVWKRGPNGAWGRFPEDSFGNTGNTEVDAGNCEEALIAEALKRSMSEM